MIGDDASYPDGLLSPRGASLPAPEPPAPPRGRSRRWVLAAGVTTLVGAAAGVAFWRREDEITRPKTLVFAGGVKGATYLEVGSDIAEAIRSISPGTQVDLKITGASVANLKLLNSGEADIGFSALDAAAVDPGVLSGRLTGISRIYESYVQLMVRRDSDIRSLTDLEGKVVSVGAANSGTEFTSTLMMRTAGIAPRVIRKMGQNPSSAALKSGQVDAVFSATGLPTPAIATLSQEFPIRLIPIGEFYPMLERAVPHVYSFASIPVGTYANTEETSTIAVPNALLAREGLPADTVTLVTEAVLSESSTRFWKNKVSQSISRDRANKLGTVTMNPVAKSWLDNH